MKSACIVHVLLYLEAVLLVVGAQQEALAVLISGAQVSLGSHPLPEIFAGPGLVPWALQLQQACLTFEPLPFPWLLRSAAGLLTGGALEAPACTNCTYINRNSAMMVSHI